MDRTPNRSRVCAAVFVGLLLAAGIAQAAPISFSFEFSGAPNNTATATGFITFEETLLPNPTPGVAHISLSSPVVLDLQMTISGAVAGNGTYGLNDFTWIDFDTWGVSLDLTRELVGQPTIGSPWGTTDGNGGDFNFFLSPLKGAPYAEGPAATTGAPAPPEGRLYFTLCADGGNSSCMELVSMAPAAVPTLGAWGGAALAVALLATCIVAFRRRPEEA